MKPTVLLIEDEALMAELLADNLQNQGYWVCIAQDGAEALDLWRELKPDAVVLDVMLPKVSGLEVCHQMRKAGYSTPVLFLSARGAPEERVEGLSAGGDDYLAKPFHLPEFLLRVSNLLKRKHTEPERLLRFGGHTVNFRAYNAKLSSGRTEQLGEREVAILQLLYEKADGVVSRDEILDRVWGQEVFPSSRTIDNFVVRLRRLFEPNPAQPIYFHTVWGVGYRFTPQGLSQPEILPSTGDLSGT